MAMVVRRSGDAMVWLWCGGARKTFGDSARGGGGAVVNDSRVVQRFCGSGGDVMLWRYDGGGVVSWGSRGRCGVVVVFMSMRWVLNTHVTMMLIVVVRVLLQWGSRKRGDGAGVVL